jgi:hypothetical protein
MLRWISIFADLLIMIGHPLRSTVLLPQSGR